MTRIRQIKKFHEEIVQYICDEIGWKLKIDEDFGWEEVRIGKRIEFGLSPKDNGIFYTYPKRNRGNDRCAFMFKTGDILEHTLMSSWSEEWRKSAKKEFTLESASWSFFWGLINEDKKQIIRAEWHNMNSTNFQHALPHWHIDIDVVIKREQNNKGKDVNNQNTGLSELKTMIHKRKKSREIIKKDFLKLQKIHFGMGAWTNSTEYPNCWIVTDTELNNVIQWAIQTLRLVKHEFGY